jgi:hypothetical protein
MRPLTSQQGLLASECCLLDAKGCVCEGILFMLSCALNVKEVEGRACGLLLVLNLA